MKLIVNWIMPILTITMFFLPLDAIAEENDADKKKVKSQYAIHDIKIDFKNIKNWGMQKYIVKMRGSSDQKLIIIGSLELSAAVSDDAVDFFSKSDMKMPMEGLMLEYSESFKSSYRKNETLTLISFITTMKYNAQGKKESVEVNASIEDNRIKCELTSISSNGKKNISKQNVDFENGACLGSAYLHLIPFLPKTQGSELKIRGINPFRGMSLFEEGVKLKDVTVEYKGSEALGNCECSKYEVKTYFINSKLKNNSTLWYNEKGILVKHSADNLVLILDGFDELQKKE